MLCLTGSVDQFINYEKQSADDTIFVLLFSGEVIKALTSSVKRLWTSVQVLSVRISDFLSIFLNSSFQKYFRIHIVASETSLLYFSEIVPEVRHHILRDELNFRRHKKNAGLWTRFAFVLNGFTFVEVIATFFVFQCLFFVPETAFCTLECCVLPTFLVNISDEIPRLIRGKVCGTPLLKNRVLYRGKKLGEREGEPSNGEWFEDHRRDTMVAWWSGKMRGTTRQRYKRLWIAQLEGLWTNTG